MRVLLFDGQGSAPTISSPTPTTAAAVSQSPLATLFLRQAHAVLSSRLSDLSVDAAARLQVRATRDVLAALCEGSITFPTSDPALLQLPLVSLPSLYVAQVVRLLEELEGERAAFYAETLPSPAAVIGYSSGLLPALLVASSFPAPGQTSKDLSPHGQLLLLRNAVALFEVSLLLGIEAQGAKEEMLEQGGLTLDDPLREKEWAMVVFGETRSALETRIEQWNFQTSDSLLWIHLTAQTTATCHTISGLPHVLRDFVSSVSQLHRSPLLTPANLYSPPSPAPSTSSEDSVSTSSHILSRKSSSMSVETTATSPCPSRKVSECSLKAPIPLAPLSAEHVSFSATSQVDSLPESSSFTARRLTSKPLNIFTLFHTQSSHLSEVRGRVLSQLFRCPSTNLSFPLESPETPTYDTTPRNTFDMTFTDREDDIRASLSTLSLSGKYTLHDTHSGAKLSPECIGKALVERVLELILLEPVEFEQVLQCVALSAADEQAVELLNFGPGTGLARVAMRSLKERISHASVTFNDVSSSSPSLERRNAKPSHEPIAIVGMAVNLPGARNTEELWRVLEQGINTVEEIPRTRFDISSYTDGSSGNPNRKMKTRFGNFLPDSLHSSFDSSFFHISPREARALDPQMRVVMRVGLQAAEAAGLVVEEFSVGDSSTTVDANALKSEEVGCFVGVATNDYPLNLRHDLGVHYATGTLPAFLAGRLAYSLHLSGPSVVLDTACSSSLVAIHQACRALLAGDCKAALAGGVNIISSPDMYLGLDRAHFLSSTGNCKPWDASADGYCRSEGCGMFVFKRLSDALAASDNILGVIRGTEINQSSAAVSITRPHGPTQMTLLKSLLRQSDVSPEEVNVVEAHGTGTQAGDPEEMRTLRDVLSPSNGLRRGATNPLTVTGIKANIGHAEAASGAASLAKVLLMLRHRAIPSQISLETLNPKIERLDKDFTRINTTGSCIEWAPNAAGSRVALVNNFGAAGNNAALLVEEAPERALVRSQASASADTVLISLSAESQEALLRLCDSYALSVTDETLVEFAYTASARRKVRPWRMAVTASSANECAKALSDAHPMLVTPGQQKVIFIFSGQGGQHLGMGRQLYQTSPLFRSVIDSSHKKLVSWGYPGVMAIIDPYGDKSGLPKKGELVAFQCAMFVLECALFELWKHWGVKPDAVSGHSLGEYAALVAAGVISLDSGLRIVAHRAVLMTEKCELNATSMLLVRQSAADVCEALVAINLQHVLSIACYNSGRDVVVGGPVEFLKTFKCQLESTGAKCFDVAVPFAYHTSAMDPILDDLTAFASKFEFAAPSIPITSNVFGGIVRPGDASVFNAHYFAMHCRQPVQFEKGMAELSDELDSVAAFVELGPHPTTLPMVQSFASAMQADSLHSLHKKTTARAALFTALSKMFVFRTAIAWGRVYRELYPGVTCMEIPGYPLAEKEYWVPYVEETSTPDAPAAPVNVLTKYSFLGSWTQKPLSKASDSNISEFETPIEKLADYITGHGVAGAALCPASVYFELALSAAACTFETSEEFFDDILTLSDVHFTQPLVYDTSRPVAVQTTINLHPSGSKHAGTFSISSVFEGKEQSVHCTGFIQRREKEVTMAKLQLHSGNVHRGKEGLIQRANAGDCETLRTRTIYDLIFPRVVQYSKLYQVIDSMTLDEENGIALATIRLSEKQSGPNFMSQPVFIDALLHAAGFLINSRASAGDAFICNQVDSSKMLFDIDLKATYEIFCTTSSVNEGSIIADAFAIEKTSRRVVAHLKRMRFSRLRLNSLARVLSRAEDGGSRFSSPAVSVTPRFNSNSPSTPMTPRKLGSPFHPKPHMRTSSTLSCATFVQPTLDSSNDIIPLVAEACGIKDSEISASSRFDEIGIDSLGWIELLGQLKSNYPAVSLDSSAFMQCSTVGELMAKLTAIGIRPSTSMPEIRSPNFESMPKHPFIARSGSFVSCPQMTPPPRLSSPTPISTVAEQVKEILSAVLEVSPSELTVDCSLEAFGLDSLGSIEALDALQERFQIELSGDFFVIHPTVGEVQMVVARLVDTDGDSESVVEASPFASPETSAPAPVQLGLDRILLPLQKGRVDASQLFLIHDGSGLSHCYSRIGPLDRTLLGLNNPKLFTGEQWTGGVSEMAAHYVKQIRPLMTAAGCVLGGWSFGGVVAFEMATKLMREGVKVAGVVLIDSPSPFTTNPLPEHLIDSVIRTTAPALSGQKSKVIKLARTQMTFATQALVAYNPHAALSGCELPKVVMLRCTEAFNFSDAEKNMPGFDAFLEDRTDVRSTVADWERLTGREVPVLDIPGNHFEPFAAENVGEVTRQISYAISILEESS